MEFYKIENPTTKQIADAIINREYIPIESILPKAKQIKVFLLDYWNANEILVTFDNVTNTGGVPIFLSDKCDLFEVASEDDNWYNMTDEDQNDYIELLCSYLRTYDDIFNLHKS
jgi:hypothetical protein